MIARSWPGLGAPPEALPYEIASSTRAFRKLTMALFDKVRNFDAAKRAQAAGLYPYFVPSQAVGDTEVVVDGESKVMIGSNNYLGLTHHPKVIEAAEKALRKYGSGCTGSRYLNGTLDLHERLEEKLAVFLKTEAALVFSTGFQTNLGAISALADSGVVVFIDQLCHASIVDGCRLSQGRTVMFQHNDAADLERSIESVGAANALVIVDGVYSMEGDIADMPALLDLAERYGCGLMVDDAHATGVLGAHGRGTAEHFGVEERVDLVMGTFSKSFASIGGFVAGDEAVVHYIKHHARSLIFSASAPPAAIAAVLASLEVIQEEPERREHLWRITARMKSELQGLGFDTGNSRTPVIPIIIGEVMPALSFWRQLFDAGVITNVAISPAVPAGRELLRTSYVATHTDAQLDFVLEKIETVGRKLGVI